MVSLTCTLTEHLKHLSWINIWGGLCTWFQPQTHTFVYSTFMVGSWWLGHSKVHMYTYWLLKHVNSIGNLCLKVAFVSSHIEGQLMNHATVRHWCILSCKWFKTWWVSHVHNIMFVILAWMDVWGCLCLYSYRRRTVSLTCTLTVNLVYSSMNRCLRLPLFVLV